ncbi:MAG: bifunctional precorrin-2 dehydrogenase/sirohydrochlorin ferrochelatase [Desulfovibrio sp.]|jgi:precorrin-2 dehydrogenase/sirohydrochlorin ferrochelatase|nr:bifunctional precorrin-2 dehydrogenase/sirohydrochlorin ferrochelatase [Desulfovibrio sp.]
MESHTPLYPVFLSLKNRHCLVAGLGEVGLRKLAHLLDCKPASVLVLDTKAPSEKVLPLLEKSCVRFERRTCSPEDITGKILVFAATGSKEENARIAGLCLEMGVLCNCAAPPALGNVFLPAVARQGRLAAALSTGGASPALARQWRDELNAWLIPRRRAAHLLGRLRPLLLDLPDNTGKNKKILQKLATPALQRRLADGNAGSCQTWLAAELPAELHAHIAPLLAELFDALP